MLSGCVRRRCVENQAVIRVTYQDGIRFQAEGDGRTDRDEWNIMSFPETDTNLIHRLRDHRDREAWGDFVAVYRPALVRFALRKGMQPTDAEDLAQTVFVAVAGAVGRWEVDERRARFSTWLYTIANRQVIDELRRRTPVVGGTTADIRLAEEAARGEDSRLLRTEVRRQLFHRAASDVRAEFPEASWTAFWLTAVEGLAAAEVAPRVGKTVGAVYAARARVMRRLVDQVHEMDGESHTGEIIPDEL